jgi:S1-C subfamily serine protease
MGIGKEANMTPVDDIASLRERREAIVKQHADAKNRPPSSTSPTSCWPPGPPRHAYIGIQPATLTPEIARLLGINRTSGVVAMQVAAPSPAAEAGIQPGDIVITFNGQETATAEDLIAALRGTKPGDRVQLPVLRGANTQQITVTVAERAAP